jgi:teichuronic acid biosynthesis glycosyltransferase TuaC
MAAVQITSSPLDNSPSSVCEMAAMPELMKRHLDIHYVVVGGNAPWDGNEDELRRLAASLGLTDRLTITGSIPPEQVAAWLQAADIFVLSTEGEGWCNAIMEALAVGLPVVTTDVGGNREIICRDELGTVVPFDDHAALVGALNEALDRHWDRKAILDYVAPFNWDTVADRTVEVFRQAVGKQDLAQRRKGAEVRRGK